MTLKETMLEKRTKKFWAILSALFVTIVGGIVVGVVLHFVLKEEDTLQSITNSTAEPSDQLEIAGSYTLQQWDETIDGMITLYI